MQNPATGADVLARCLAERGVTHIFGMPGSHTTAVYDAIHRRGGFSTILIRNEQAGAFAADGYARVTGRPGVVCTTAGPGATNALTGIGEAWADSVPVLLITGQVNADRLHEECGNYHEIDLEGIFRPCTKWVGTVRSNADIPRMVDDAFRAMTTGRPRPACLILPQDLMAAAAEGSARSASGTGPLAERADHIDGDRIDEAKLALWSAKRPIILAGGGAVWSGAAGEIRAAAAALNCPVVTTLNGKGILDERDPYSLGHARSVRAKAALPHADAMLAVGCRFTEVMTGFRTMPVPAGLVQIDIDPDQIGMNHPVSVGLVGDAKAVLRRLNRTLPPGVAHGSEWGDIWDRARAIKHPAPEWLIETLRAELPDDAVLFTDASEMGFRAQTDFPAYAPRTVFYPSNFITLGWGFPAAVGAAVARPEVPVVSLSGDGGFVMTSQELTTAVRYKLRLIAVVHNDSAYGAMKNIQKRRHGGRYVDSDLNNPDFLKLADAYGVPASRAPDAASLSTALRTALARQGPTLIEVPDVWRTYRM